MGTTWRRQGETIQQGGMLLSWEGDQIAYVAQGRAADRMCAAWEEVTRARELRAAEEVRRKHKKGQRARAAERRRTAADLGTEGG